jgi:hypothetical protein
VTVIGDDWAAALRALHGDLRPLVALLRSDVPIGRTVRDYLADELERPEGRRFRQRRKTDLGKLNQDLNRLLDISGAKLELATERYGKEALHHLHEIGDKEAFKRLVSTGKAPLDGEIQYKNAKRRLLRGRSR